jgi:hypothetical protein
VTPRLAGHRHGGRPRQDVTDGQGARNADYSPMCDVAPLVDLAAQNASYARPAVLGLAGDVTRRRILAVDIGCGSGQRIAPPDAPV